MKVLIVFYLVIWIFAVYYACGMIYKLLGDESIPLFSALGMLFFIKWFLNYKYGDYKKKT